MIKTINKTFEEFKTLYKNKNILSDALKADREKMKRLDDHLVAVFIDDIVLFPYNPETDNIFIDGGYVPNEDNAQWVRDIVKQHKERVEISEFVSSLFKKSGSFQLDILDISYSEFRKFVGENLDDNSEFPEYRLYDNDFDMPNGLDYYADFEDFEVTYARLNDGFAKLTLGTNEKYYQAYDACKLLTKDDISDLKSKINTLRNGYEATSKRIDNIRCLEFMIFELEKF